ncbi:MAG: hypothetical protein NZM27_03530 [Acetobacteraceae bacterium]|nr:hypothetical protein [Acetobacteraceae bacterium]MDW8397667.1 hypothetical protein [Acetobacteraceae bacterium]
MLVTVGIRLPPMLDPVAEAGERAARLAPAPQQPPAETVTLRPNPSLSLDIVTGLVVLEFRSLSGDVVGTVPTARELAAYRAAALTDAPLPDRGGVPQPSGTHGQAPTDKPEQPAGR